jgi:hypothetical protein
LDSKEILKDFFREFHVGPASAALIHPSRQVGVGTHLLAGAEAFRLS